MSQPISMVDEIFGSAEGFLNQEITQAWGDAGYTTSSVERWTVWKEVKGWLNPRRLIDPFGFFGGSIFRSTRYFYNYVQQVAPINNGFITDPIQTYAMSAVMQKQDVAVAVQQSLKQGLGYGLKKYWQYHKHRYKNRAWTYRTYKTTNFKPSSITFNRQGFIDSLPEGHIYQIIDTSLNWSLENQLYQHWLKETFGIYSFGANAEPIDKSSKPTEKSIGITVWSGDNVPDQEFNIPSKTVVSTKDYPLVKNIAVGSSEEFSIYRRFDNPFAKGDAAEESDADNGMEVNPYDFVVTVKVTVQSERVVNNQKERTYLIEEFQKYFKYTEENFYYLKEDMTSNYPNFEDYFTFEEDTVDIQDEFNSDTSKELFRFYPPIPIKDWFSGKDTWTQTIPAFEDTKLVSAQTKLNEVIKNSSNQSDERTEEISSNSIKGNKTKQKQEKETRSATRDLSREINRELNRGRKYKYNRDALADIKDYDEKRIKRHIEYMCSLIGVDYLSYVTGLMSTNNWAGGYGGVNTYQTSIYLGAVFANQSLESMEYWYEWAKRQYKLAGEEKSFTRWNAMVQSASSLEELPQQVVKYETTDGTHWGGFSFCFIRKLKIVGRIRKIKRHKRYKDILRGKSITIASIEDLRSIVEPPKSLSLDEWHYVEASGKEYPVGGGYFSGSGWTETSEPMIEQVFQNYSYTYFAKQSGKNEITCYAVCGLQFHTKVNDRSVWCSAWYDLEMEYSRLYQKYIEGKSGNDIQSEIRIEHGSRKHRHINHAYNIGIVPLEYDVIRRMNPTTLERFVQRATLNYSWLFQEQKGKRSSMKYIAPIITVAAFIASVVMTMWGQAWSWALFAKAVAIAAVVTITVKLAIEHLIIPVFKMLGLKGIVAYIIIIIILIVAYMYGADGSQAAAPYLSETTAKSAEHVGTQAVQETVRETSTQAVQQATTQGFQSTLKEMGTQIFNQLIGSNLAQVFANSVNYLSQLEGNYQKEEMTEMQATWQAEQEAMNESIKALEAQQEEILGSMGKFSREAVLGEFVHNVIKLKDFGLQYEKGLDNINPQGTLEYLWSFLDMRISNDIEFADPINVTQFKVG